MTRAVQLVQLHSAPWIFLVGPVMLARPPLVGPWNFHFPVEDPSFCFICSLSSRWLLEIVGFGGGEKAWRRRWECTEKCCVWWGNCQKIRDHTTPSTLERISWTIEKLKLATPMPSKSSSIELTTTPSGSSTRSCSLYLSMLSRGKLSFVFDLVELCFKLSYIWFLNFIIGRKCSHLMCFHHCWHLKFRPLLLSGVWMNYQSIRFASNLYHSLIKNECSSMLGSLI